MWECSAPMNGEPSYCAICWSSHHHHRYLLIYRNNSGKSQVSNHGYWTEDEEMLLVSCLINTSNDNWHSGWKTWPCSCTKTVICWLILMEENVDHPAEPNDDLRYCSCHILSQLYHHHHQHTHYHHLLESLDWSSTNFSLKTQKDTAVVLHSYVYL